MLSVFREHGVVAKDSRDNINVTAENRSIYQLVHPGWLVVNRMKAWQGSVGISSLRGIVSGHYLCFEPRHVEDPRYLNWLLRSQPYTTGYYLLSRGVRVGQAEIDNDDFRVMPLLLPPPEEQRAIADYLVRETAKIDTLIAKQERLIENLRERRSAIVDRVVTGGLDGAAPLKPSGFPWLGDIPAHWQVQPLWSMFQRIKDVDHPGERMLSVFRDFGVVAKDSRDNINVTAKNRSIYQLVDHGWLVTNRMKAWQGSVGISSLRGIVSGHYICFTPQHVEDPRYLNWLFRAPRYATGYRLISRGVRIGQAEIDNDEYRVLPVIVPPLNEQREIAHYLDQQTDRIDLVISRAARFIDLANERRTALITAAVTGQIDVRDEVA
jgi:type I restriction enzyme S subunit